MTKEQFDRLVAESTDEQLKYYAKYYPIVRFYMIDKELAELKERCRELEEQKESLNRRLGIGAILADSIDD